MARGILVPAPGIEPEAPAVEARSLNHWTSREVPSVSSLFNVGVLLVSGKTKTASLELLHPSFCLNQSVSSVLF